MSGRVKVKKIKVVAGMKEDDMAEMFNQMLGTGGVNLSIAYPRYLQIKLLCQQLVKLFSLVGRSPFLATSAFDRQRAQIMTFCDVTTIKIAELFHMDFTDSMWNLSLVDDELQKQFSECYAAIKKSDLINTLIITYDRLVRYKKNFSDEKTLNHRFIVNMPGVEWCPLPFTNFNLKAVFTQNNISPTTLQFFMVFLHKTHQLLEKLHVELKSPDIDVDQFVDVIVSSITELQKRPELNRCGKAFNKIKQSVEMLKTNFNGYYQDFLDTKDNTIMMQHFILDVSKSTEADPTTAQQFRTIIAYYKKMADSQIDNPKARALIEKMNESFSTMNRGTENLVKVWEESPEVSETQDDSDPIMLPGALTSIDTTAVLNNIPVERVNELTAAVEKSIALSKK